MAVLCCVAKADDTHRVPAGGEAWLWRQWDIAFFRPWIGPGQSPRAQKMVNVYITDTDDVAALATTYAPPVDGDDKRNGRSAWRLNPFPAEQAALLDPQIGYIEVTLAEFTSRLTAKGGA